MTIYDKYRNSSLIDYPEFINSGWGKEKMAEVKELKKVEEEAVDLSQYEGEKSEIETVTTEEVNSNYSDSGKQWVVKVQTKKVTEIENIDIHASELFNLKEDGEGWSTQGNLQKLLDKQKVEHPKDLEGTEVTLRIREKNTKHFLGFIY